ncbi:MAG: hypothetical protein ACFWT4_25400 [Citrobacter braakii]
MQLYGRCVPVEEAIFRCTATKTGSICFLLGAFCIIPGFNRGQCLFQQVTRSLAQFMVQR